MTRATSYLFGGPVPAFQYESLREMPTLVRVLANQHRAWVVGGAAKFMCGIGPRPRDWDVIVPESEWHAASKHFPYGATVNTMGGVKATSDGVEVDVWASDLGWHWVSSFGGFVLLAVSPSTQQVSVCTQKYGSRSADSNTPTLTDAEREALEWCAEHTSGMKVAAALRGLLARLGGEL